MHAGQTGKFHHGLYSSISSHLYTTEKLHSLIGVEIPFPLKGQGKVCPSDSRFLDPDTAPGFKDQSPTIVPDILLEEEEAMEPEVETDYLPDENVAVLLLPLLLRVLYI